LSNEEKTNDYENFEKGMIYMKILKKGGGVVEKRGEEETKSMPHAPVQKLGKPWSWMILTRKKGEKNQGHFHLVSKHILNIYSL
jgi:hypothetical protein